MSRQREQKVWDSFKRGIDPRKLKAIRIENLYSGEGLPDTLIQNRNKCVFWLELKALEDWPAREATKPLRGVFEPGQLGFAQSWLFWGGWSFVLLRVREEFYLCDPRLDLENMTRSQIVLSAIRTGKKDIITYLEIL